MKRYRRRRRFIPFFRPSGWGSVYLLRSTQEPDLFKVGFTSRKTKDRKSELQRVAGDTLKIAYTVTMPHAYVVEGVVLRRLHRRILGRGDRRGTEWFRLRRHETLDHIKRRIDRAARLVELIARLKFSWPRGTKVKRFDPQAKKGMGKTDVT